MVVDVQTGVDELGWKKALANIPSDLRDVYFTPEYHDLHVANGDGEAFCVTLRAEKTFVVIPGIRMPINGTEYWDLQTCNGFGGPLASPGANSEFITCAWRAWKTACAEQGMVASFFRLHPLMDNESALPECVEVRRERNTVYVDLSEGMEHVWRSSKPQHRNMVSRGAREGAVVLWNEADCWDEFIRLYHDAMLRMRAPKRLCFKPAYFDALKKLPGVQLAAIRRGDSVTAAAVFMFGSRWAHYHLSARMADAPNYLTNCILQAAFERAAEAGLAGLHLGGGRTPALDDGLLKFKLSTGGRLMEFKVALVVTNLEAFHRLCARWAIGAGEAPSWLLGYRQPMPHGAVQELSL